MEEDSLWIWEKRFRDYPGHFTLSMGASWRALRECEDRHRVVFPEDYAKFMRFSNGLDVLKGRISLWRVPEGDEDIPKWKSMEYMNSPQVRGRLPLPEDVFLIGGNDLGDYLGITCEKEGYPYVYLSLETGERWHYSDLASWFEEVWEEWVINE